MSVPKGERKEGKLGVIEASKNLVRYTHDRCLDEDIFPKKQRWMMATSVWTAAWMARAKIIRANSIRVDTKSEAEERILLEKEAISHLETLLELIDILHITERISSKRAEFWVGLTVETLYPLKGLLKSDRQRYKEYLDA